MRNNDILHLCLQNLLRRRSRTLLTVLGVVIGCCSIVIMVSLGIGMKESQEKMLAEMGDLTIITVSAPQSGHGKLKLGDAAVKSFAGVAGVESVSPRLTLDSYTLRLLAGTNDRYTASWATVVGMDTAAMEKMGYKLTGGKAIGASGEVLVGQYFAYGFADGMRPEGSNTVDRWGGDFDKNGNPVNLPPPWFDPVKTPLKLELTLANNSKLTVPLKIVGTMKEDYSKGSETSDGIVMSLADMRELLKKAQGSAAKPIAYSSVLVKVHGISQVADAENAIKTMGFTTQSMESIRKPMEKEARQKQMMLGGLGAISLLVAALGITNTMIMSITERTREIGIMKALGCYVHDIRVMFLGEAGIIGLLGGIAGCVFSFLISLIINLASLGGVSAANLAGALAGGEKISRLSVIPVWLYAFAVVFSVFIGLVSGYYPSNKAVQIPALEAIKSE